MKIIQIVFIKYFMLTRVFYALNNSYYNNNNDKNVISQEAAG